MSSSVYCLNDFAVDGSIVVGTDPGADRCPTPPLTPPFLSLDPIVLWLLWYGLSLPLLLLKYGCCICCIG